MMFRQDFKKIYTSAVFISSSFLALALYGLLFNGVKFAMRDVLFLLFVVLFPTAWCLSHYWYYIKIEGGKFMTVAFGRPLKSIAAEDMLEFSYEDNPARPLARISFGRKDGSVGQADFTTGAWNPKTLLSISDELRQINPRLMVKIDERTEKKFAKEKDYHLHHPKSILGWVLLGVRQLAAGVCFGIVLVAVSKL